MSNITFDEKRLMYKKDAAEDNEEKPAGSKLPYFIAGGIFALLLVLGLVITLVVSLSNKPVQAQATDMKQPVAPVPEEKGKVEQPNAAGKNEGAKDEKDQWGWKENNPPPMRANDRKKMADQQQPPQPEDKRGAPPIVIPGPGDNADELKIPQKGGDQQGVDQQKPPSKKGGVEPGKGSMNQTAEDRLPSLEETRPVTKTKDPIIPLPPAKNNAKANDPSLIPVKYHQLMPQLVREEVGWPLAPQAETCKFIRLLGKNVFNNSPYEHAVKASDFLITHAAGSLQFRKRAAAGEPIDVVEIVSIKQRLVMRPLGADEVRPQDTDEIIKMLQEYPLLCETENGGLVLHCFQAINNRIDQPPATLELTIIKPSTTLKAENETVALQYAYPLLHQITARMQCFGTEARGMIDVALQVGKLESIDIKTEAGQKVEATEPYRRFVKLTPVFRFEKPQVANFEATLHYEGSVPKEPQKSDYKDDKAAFNKAADEYEREKSRLLREARKNSPHHIILKDLKVIAHFDLGKKKLQFLLWQLTP